jgi:hypothetical protein
MIEPENDEVDQEASDLLIVQTDHKRIPQFDRSSSILIHMDSRQEWFEGRHTAMFFTCGYPSIGSSVDYETLTIETTQVILVGSYVRKDSHSNCSHELKIHNSDQLTDFNGLSGSPVFCTSSVAGKNRHPKFCGMAIRGSAGSRSVHFLEAEAIYRALQKISSDPLRR